MRAFQIVEFNSPPVFNEIPRPEPAAGEIRLRIHACGLNFADLLMSRGKYQETPTPPFTLGMEVAGVVEALGPGVEGPPPGTRVAVFGGRGGLAETGCFPVRNEIPRHLCQRFANEREGGATLNLSHGVHDRHQESGSILLVFDIRHFLIGCRKPRCHFDVIRTGL